MKAGRFLFIAMCCYFVVGNATIKEEDLYANLPEEDPYANIPAPKPRDGEKFYTSFAEMCIEERQKKRSLVLPDCTTRVWTCLCSREGSWGEDHSVIRKRHRACDSKHPQYICLSTATVNSCVKSSSTYNFFYACPKHEFNKFSTRDAKAKRDKCEKDVRDCMQETVDDPSRPSKRSPLEPFTAEELKACIDKARDLNISMRRATEILYKILGKVQGPDRSNGNAVRKAHTQG